MTPNYMDFAFSFLLGYVSSYHSKIMWHSTRIWVQSHVIFVVYYYLIMSYYQQQFENLFLIICMLTTLNCTSPLYLSTYKLTILFCLTATGGWMANNFIILQTSKVFPILSVSKSELETLAHPFVSSDLIFCNALKLMYSERLYVLCCFTWFTFTLYLLLKKLI